MNEELTLGDVLTPTAPQPEPTLNDYYLRCRESDRPKLYAMAVALGVLAEANGIYTLASGWEGAWSEVGTIYRDGDPVCTPDGEVYWHANLRLKIVSLTDYAIQMAADHPEIASALQDLAGWFVTDASGNPVPPQQPAQVWL